MPSFVLGIVLLLHEVLLWYLRKMGVKNRFLVGLGGRCRRCLCRSVEVGSMGMGSIDVGGIRSDGLVELVDGMGRNILRPF